MRPGQTSQSKGQSVRLGLNLGYRGVGHARGPPGARPGGRPARLLGGVGGRGVRVGLADGAVLDRRRRPTRIDVGSAVMQIPARTPAMTAMTAATLDTLSGGRFRLGLGVSGPQVSEGWHGVRFAKPLARTREYVDIVRLALAREPVAYDGEHYTLPLPDGPGQGAAADRASGPRAHPDLPGRGRAEEPRAGRRDRRRLAGDLLRAGVRRRAARARRGRPGQRPARRWTASTWSPTVPLVVGDDVEPAPAPVRCVRRALRRRHGQPRAELLQRSSRRGWATRTRLARCRTSTCPSARRRPRPRCRWSSSIGPACSVRWSGSPTRMRDYAASGVTTLSVSLFVGDVEDGVRTLRAVKDAFEKSGVGE